MKNEMKKTIVIALFLAVAVSVFAQITNTNLPPVVISNITIISNAVPSVVTNVPVHVLPVLQQAQDQLSQYLVMLIPIIVPLMIAGLKKFLPDIPTWALPILAPALGALADFIMQKAGVETGGTIKGMLLGSAGVGLRELVNQMMQLRPTPTATTTSTGTTTGSPPVAPPTKLP